MTGDRNRDNNHSYEYYITQSRETENGYSYDLTIQPKKKLPQKQAASF
ncbi:hypothetical protein J0K78_01590 [Halobacillus sp. GSS1]|nr:hypothetical protein [Halobacillus sp. GSS1]MBN9652941.1 hypothetical protein [Halobacillus sp. GSS1]